MTKRISAFIILLLSIISAQFVAIVADASEKSPRAISHNIKKHPLYSTYKFNNTDKVINIGTQPLYMSTGLVSETMKRDLILKKALKERGFEIRFFPFLKGLIPAGCD